MAKRIVGPDTSTPAEEPTGRRGRRGRRRGADYRQEQGIDGKISSLSETADWVPGVHKPLKSKDFESEDIFLDWQAQIYERRANELKAQATELRKLGTPEQRKSAAKFQRTAKAIERLRAELKAAGIDPEALLKNPRK
ncbi:hypothetical protein C4588_01025 [Candidatus Parcubacteria bacterium]|nr:MAG: hypothetical protein C4588_01025 [Candidatus Parcubacteria bacterium]